MNEFLGVGFALSFMTTGVLIYLLDQYKQDNYLLKRINDGLLKDNGFLANKNIELWKEIENLKEVSIEEKNKLQDIINKSDVREYQVDQKISWLDSKGNIEYGIIIDDSKIDGKTFVHVRRLNNRGKFVGNIITISANRIKLEN